MPDSLHRQDLLSVRDRTRETMQQEIDDLRRARQDCVTAFNSTNERIRSTGRDMVLLKKLVTQLVDVLAEFGKRLPVKLSAGIGLGT